MEYRPLGRTGIAVSELGLGAMAFGAAGNPDHDASIQVVHRALDAGINFVDTADIYSAGESESVWVARIAASSTRRSAASVRNRSSAASRTRSSQRPSCAARRWPGGITRHTARSPGWRVRYAAGPCPRRHAGDQAAARRRARRFAVARARGPAVTGRRRVPGAGPSGLVRRP